MKGVDTQSGGQAGHITSSGTPVTSKAITSDVDLAAAIAQLQQPNANSRLPRCFVALLDFAGWPIGNFQTDDLQLNERHAKAIDAMHRCPNLDGVVATMIQRLGDSNHRLEMVSALVKFAGPERQMGSVIAISDNPKWDALSDKAREAVNQAGDVKTVTAALASPDRMLRRWGVQKFGNAIAKTKDWSPLLPQIENLASGDDRDLRYDAIGSLAHFPGTEEFLDTRFTREKSAFLLMSLIEERGVWGEAFNGRFLPRFVDLLSDPDETVRDEALDFIGCNSIWAEARQVPFGRDVFDKALKATRSDSAKERFEAVFALAYIGHLVPDASREAFLRLVNDPDETVRWRLGFCFVGQYERDDVKHAIAALVNDKSPLVRYLTILAVGPNNYVPQLQELAQDSRTQVAEWASEKLKQIAAVK